MIPKDNALLSSNGVSPASPRELLDGGSKGGTPSTAAFGGPESVAGPLLGSLNPVQSDDINLAPKKKGRPRSGKSKMKFSVSPKFAKNMEKVPPGARGKTVEIGTTLFLDRLGIEGWLEVRSDLVDLSIRLQQLLEHLANDNSLTLEQRGKAATYGAAILSRIATYIKL
jgi:hypothetical protein